MTDQFIGTVRQLPAVPRIINEWILNSTMEEYFLVEEWLSEFGYEPGEDFLDAYSNKERTDEETTALTRKFFADK